MSEELKELFYSEAKNTVSSLRDILGKSLISFKEENVNEAYRLIHTLKGAAGFMGLSDLVFVCHKWEENLNLIRKTGKFEEFIPTLSSAIDEIDGILSFSSDQEVFTVKAEQVFKLESEILEILEDISRGKGINLRERLGRVYNMVLSLRVRPLFETYKKIRAGFNDLLSKTKKKAVLETLGGNLTVEVESLKGLENILIHLVRNAVDHGIEPPEERVRKGKGEFGLVRVEANLEGSYLRISVSDDGRGIDLEKLERKAKDLGIKYSDPFELVFLPGISTKEEVTEISGRGYGMDVVLEEARKLGGWVEVKTEKDVGTTFEVYVLSNVWNSRYIFGKFMGYNIAINLDYVYRVVGLDRVLKSGDEYILDFEGNYIPLVGYSEKAKYAVVLVRKNRAFSLAFEEIFNVGSGSFVPFQVKGLDFSGTVISEGGEVFVLPNLLRWFGHRI
jgi:Chemotaxis protein histidine kinase and related kinases